MAKYRFEQIAINSTEKKKPVEEDRFTYLGLEHLDSGSLKVTRFGSDVAPIGEKLVMRKGDVLFGKRRAYQKKVAIAPFDGIFSAHGMVLRPNVEVIDPDFFPLFISSDYFLDAAIKISVGSLSPTINWRDLKILEFDLPDLETQRKLAAVLWSINDTMESYKKLISATDELVKSQFIEMFGDPVKNPFGWPTMTLDQATKEIVSGQCLNGDAGKLQPGQKAVLKVSAVTYGSFDAKGWYEDHDLYHRIGYLITSGTSLHKIFALSKDKKKSEFNESLDELIKKSVAISGNYAELSYEKSLDYKRISTLLLLFNIESVRRSDGHAQRFPFDQFKHHKGSNVTWSLEHIHAQQSEGMKTQDVWKKWLELHIPSVESIGGEHSELIDEMQGAINADKLERTVFESIQQKVLGLLSVSGNTEYMHSIANLALLNTADNAALNNSTFDVKRNDIIQMDKKGQYIPFCTKMVFLKYYTPSAENQLHFWGQADRIAYIKAINDVLSDYIEPIVLEKEETK